MSESIYRQRMNSYIPYAIQNIYEFQAIIDGEYPEFDLMAENKNQITDDAYLTTMGESRIKQWEKVFSIVPLKDSSLDDRRETIMARIRGQGKLNTDLINRIVNAFTGGTACSWIEDSVLHIEIEPPKGSKEYKFENIKRELSYKVPAHLDFELTRKYVLWIQVHETNKHWLEVRTCYDTWRDVMYGNKRPPNQLGITTFERFLLG